MAKTRFVLMLLFPLQCLLVTPTDSSLPAATAEVSVSHCIRRTVFLAFRLVCSCRIVTGTLVYEMSSIRDSVNESSEGSLDSKESKGLLRDALIAG